MVSGFTIIYSPHDRQHGDLNKNQSWELQIVPPIDDR